MTATRDVASARGAVSDRGVERMLIATRRHDVTTVDASPPRTAVESMPIVATAVPKRPAAWPVSSPRPDVRPRWYEASTAAETETIGIAVERIPTATPAMMFVPCPVVDASAMSRTGWNA